MILKGLVSKNFKKDTMFAYVILQIICTQVIIKLTRKKYPISKIET